MDTELKDSVVPKKEVSRRRDLLPWWIKLFVWIFMFAGLIVSPIVLVASFFRVPVQLSLFGLQSYTALSVSGIVVLAFFVFFGIIAFGLRNEKDWAIKLAKIGAIVGIVFCAFMMLGYPFLSSKNGLHFNIRLELILLIPYLLKLNKIQTEWESFHKDNSTAPASATKKQKLRNWLIVGVVAVLAVVGIYVSTKISPTFGATKQMADTLMTDLIAGKNQDAYSLFSDDWKNQITFDQFQKQMTGTDGTPIFSHAKSYVITGQQANVSTSKGTGTNDISGQITWTDGNTAPFEIGLVESNNIWKVVSLHWGDTY